MKSVLAQHKKVTMSLGITYNPSSDEKENHQQQERRGQKVSAVQAIRREGIACSAGD